MRRTVTVVPEAGLHARPASQFVETANEYDADVRIGPADGGHDALVSAASMLAVTGLGVGSGEEVLLVSEDEAALDACEEVLTTPEGESPD